MLLFTIIIGVVTIINLLMIRKTNTVVGMLFKDAVEYLIKANKQTEEHNNLLVAYEEIRQELTETRYTILRIGENTTNSSFILTDKSNEQTAKHNSVVLACKDFDERIVELENIIKVNHEAK